MPHVMLRYQYRKLFGLTAQELELEPADQFFTNLYIYGQIQEKERIESKHKG